MRQPPRSVLVLAALVAGCAAPEVAQAPELQIKAVAKPSDRLVGWSEAELADTAPDEVALSESGTLIRVPAETAFGGDQALRLSVAFPPAGQPGIADVARLIVTVRVGDVTAATATIAREQIRDERATLRFERLKAGEYEIHIAAQDAANQALGATTSRVTVTAGAVTQLGATLTLEPNAATGPSGGLALEVTIVAPPPNAPKPVRVNFQPATAPVPVGYEADAGAGYNPERGYGWSDERGVAKSMAEGHFFTRGVDPDARLDTVAHMLTRWDGAQGTPDAARWECRVSAGTYDVTVSVGDPRYTDGTHRLTVEGTRAIDDFTPSAQQKFKRATVRVEVRDGRLTLDGAGGINTKLNFVDIVPVTAPTASPTPTPTPRPTPTPSVFGRHLPFDQAPVSTLRQSARKVYAHYFPPYPISLDNQAPTSDYYARHYLNPFGENNKFLYCGGLLRNRPLPRAPLGGDWRLEDMKTEVAQAEAIGLDGFAVDILNRPSSSNPALWNRLVALLKAVESSPSGFKIMPMFDNSGGMSDTDAEASEAFQEIMKELIRLERASGKQRLVTTDDGRLVISVFLPEGQTPAFWQTQFDKLTRDTGVKAVFLPCFVRSMTAEQLKQWGALGCAYGLSRWGARSPQAASSDEPVSMKRYTKRWMAPVAPQDIRPKSRIFTESENSANYRAMWEAAIAGCGPSDWVQLITWNDYSEHTEIAPSQNTRHGIYDMTAYYVQWFKTGQRPAIVRDVLYYFHRNQSATAVPASRSKQSDLITNVLGSHRTTDRIEVLGFLKAPGTLGIDGVGQPTAKAVGAGVQSVTAPVRPGTPRFTLKRDGRTVVDFTSRQVIKSSIETQNFQYYSGSSTR